MKHIAIVIPCYKVRKHILSVIDSIAEHATQIYAVDDACPENSGYFLKKNCQDKRVKVLFHEKNQGVGAAVMTGYRAAIADGMDIIVKIDGDG